MTKRADYLARTDGTRTFPWRVMMVSPDAAGLLGNDLVYRLARPLELQDVILDPPGPVHRGVDHQPPAARRRFQSGLNTATYRYYIDFAAEYGRRVHDVRCRLVGCGRQHQAESAIDVPGLIAYANTKGVGVLLWNEAHALARNLDVRTRPLLRLGRARNHGGLHGSRRPADAAISGARRARSSEATTWSSICMALPSRPACNVPTRICSRARPCSGTSTTCGASVSRRITR